MKYLKTEDSIHVDRRAEELLNLLDMIVFKFLFQKTDEGDLEFQLSKQECLVIRLVGKFSRCTMTELAANLSLAVSSITSIVDKLCEKGLVTRERLEHDRRVVQIQLTASGGKIYQQMRRKRLQMCRSMLESLSAIDQKNLIELFKKMGGQDQRQTPLRERQNSSPVPV